MRVGPLKYRKTILALLNGFLTINRGQIGLELDLQIISAWKVL